jgi:hypothetical protein
MGRELAPEWYFLALFELLKYFEGALEPVGAVGVPMVVLGFLFALPLLDTKPNATLRARRGSPCSRRSARDGERPRARAEARRIRRGSGVGWAHVLERVARRAALLEELGAARLGPRGSGGARETKLRP